MTIRVLIADDQAVVRAGFRVILGSAADIEIDHGAAHRTRAEQLLWMLGWFLLGYFLFAGLLAAAWARVSRQEELQSVINPALTMPIVPFVLSVFLLGDDPESKLVTGTRAPCCALARGSHSPTRYARCDCVWHS